MSRITEIETIIDNLGGDATAEELALALRGFAKRDIQAVLASRSGEGGEPFNGGTITEPLEINQNVQTPLIVDGPPSGDFTEVFRFLADGNAMFEGYSDGTGLWWIREEGSAFEFTQIGGALPGSIVEIADYGIQFKESTASGGQLLLNISRESGGQIGFFGAAPVSKPTGVAVTAAGIHAALVSLGLIAGP